MKTNFSNILFLLSLVCILIVGCSNNEATSTDNTDSNSGENEILIGELMPLTGGNSKLGENSVRGAQLAADKINEDGGIKSMDGAKIKLVNLDGTSDPTDAASKMRQLVEKEPIAILGAYASALTMASAPISEKAEIPLITTSFSDELTSREFKYTFRIPPSASDVGSAQLNYILEIGEYVDHPIKKVAIVHMNNDYGESQANGLRESIKSKGLDIVLDESYPENINDARPLAEKIKNSNPDVLFPISYINDGTKIMRALSGSDIPAVGGVGGFITPDFKEAMGEDVNGMFSVDTSSPDMYGELGEEYEEKYGEFMTQEAHDNAAALYTVVQALEENPTTDPKELGKTLREYDFDMGAAGTMPGGYISFDDVGANTVATPLMVQWQDGELKSVWPEEEAKSEPYWPTE